MGRLDYTTVVSPVQQGLPLARPAKRITWLTVLSDLCDVSSKRLPALDLARVLLGNAPSHVITAIPLKPATRIVRMYPTLSTPFRQWLAGVHTEVIERTVPARWRQLSPRKPTGRKFVAAIGQILAAEDAQFEHLLGRQIGFELGGEVATRRGG